jgi:hypothetical protein
MDAWADAMAFEKRGNAPSEAKTQKLQIRRT